MTGLLAQLRHFVRSAWLGLRSSPLPSAVAVVDHRGEPVPDRPVRAAARQHGRPARALRPRGAPHRLRGRRAERRGRGRPAAARAPGEGRRARRSGEQAGGAGALPEPARRRVGAPRGPRGEPAARLDRGGPRARRAERGGARRAWPGGSPRCPGVAEVSHGHAWVEGYARAVVAAARRRARDRRRARARRAGDRHQHHPPCGVRAARRDRHPDAGRGPRAPSSRSRSCSRA